MTTVWIVGEWSAGGDRDWQIRGVYTNERQAIEACNEPHMFVSVPLPVGISLPPKVYVGWIDYFYPLNDASSKAYAYKANKLSDMISNSPEAVGFSVSETIQAEEHLGP